MEYFPDVLAGDEAECVCVNAFAFAGDQLYLALEARNEGDDPATDVATCIARVDLSRDGALEVVHETNVSGLDYLPLRANLHYLLQSGGGVVTIADGTPSYVALEVDGLVDRIARATGDEVVIFGESALRFRDGQATRIEMATTRHLVDLHLRGSEGFAVGRSGTFLRGTLDAGFQPVTVADLPAHHFDTVFVNSRGEVGLAGGKRAYLYADARLHVLEGLADDATVHAIAEFGGREYWADDTYGLYVREGMRLVPTVPTGFGHRLNVIGEMLTVTAGGTIYLFDGARWRQLETRTDPGALVVEVPLDFA
jgi:hypothetical protein